MIFDHPRKKTFWANSASWKNFLSQFWRIWSQIFPLIEGRKNSQAVKARSWSRTKGHPHSNDATSSAKSSGAAPIPFLPSPTSNQGVCI